MKDYLFKLISSNLLIVVFVLFGIKENKIIFDGATSTYFTSNKDNFTFKVDEEKQAKHNLFHNFRDFSSLTNGSALFDGNNIVNIFSQFRLKVFTKKNHFQTKSTQEKSFLPNLSSRKNIHFPNISENTLTDTKVNYSYLDNLLAEHQWKDAEDKTRQIMFQIAGRKQNEWLHIEDLEKFPCNDLKMIDQLWIKYSNGKFGFSMQQQIYQQLNDWDKFGEQVGWLKGGKWLYNDNLIYHLNDAPEGHLPRSLGKNMGGDKGRGVLFKRVETCKLY